MPKSVGNVASDGYIFGTTVSDKIGFYGLTTAIVQRSSSAQAAVTTTAPTFSVTVFGFATSAQMVNLIALVNEMRDTLTALGIFKGSA